MFTSSRIAAFSNFQFHLKFQLYCYPKLEATSLWWKDSGVVNYIPLREVMSQTFRWIKTVYWGKIIYFQIKTLIWKEVTYFKINHKPTKRTEVRIDSTGSRSSCRRTINPSFLLGWTQQTQVQTFAQMFERFCLLALNDRYVSF